MYKCTLYSGENQPGTILMWLSKPSLDLVLVLKKQAETFRFYFSLSQGSLKIAKPFSHEESTDLI